MLIEDLRRRKGRALHFTLIDPDRQKPGEAALRAGACARFGTDAVMVGGSSPFLPGLLDATVRAIKGGVDLPVILFPNSAAAVSRHADHIYFMSLLNADDSRFLVREQVRAAPHIERARLDPISVAYLVVGTSRRPTTIERRVKLDKIGPRDVTKARDYALAARFFGLGCLYLEAGSGADRPVPLPMIRAVREAFGGPLIVGGGIRTAGRAGRIAAAGADVVVTGTIGERNLAALEGIIEAVHGAFPERRAGRT